MAETEALRICSDALVLLGDEPISSFEAGTAAAQTARALYQSIIDTALGEHPWRFNLRMETLARLTAVPPSASGFSAAYALPSSTFRVVAVFIGEALETDFKIANGQLWVEAAATSPVALEYHGTADETLWTPAFRQMAVFRLAAAFAVAIRDSLEMMAAYDRRAVQQGALARHQNATERPSLALPTGDLARRRLR